MPRKRKQPQPVPGQTHGEAAAQERRVQQVQDVAPQVAPGSFTPQVVPLSAPTQRPDEPLTAGMTIGAGPGPEVLGSPGLTEPERMDVELRALYQAHPNDDLLELIEGLQQRVPPPEAQV